MERSVLVVALTLVLPLVLYGIPYAYSSSTATTYQAFGTPIALVGPSSGTGTALCNSGDVATGGGYSTSSFDLNSGFPTIVGSQSFTSPGSPFPNGWTITALIQYRYSTSVSPYVMCLSPITVASVGVPEFGSLYVVIALGAVAYFLMSKRFAGGSAASAPVSR